MVAALSWETVAFLLLWWGIAQNGTESALEYMVVNSDSGVLENQEVRSTGCLKILFLTNSIHESSSKFLYLVLPICAVIFHQWDLQVLISSKFSLAERIVDHGASHSVVCLDSVYFRLINQWMYPYESEDNDTTCKNGIKKIQGFSFQLFFVGFRVFLSLFLSLSLRSRKQFSNETLFQTNCHKKWLGFWGLLL